MVMLKNVGADVSVNFPYATGVIHFSSFRCTGNELNLTSCSYSLPQYYCSHSYDSGVVCRGKYTKFINHTINHFCEQLLVLMERFSWLVIEDTTVLDVWKFAVTALGVVFVDKEQPLGMPVSFVGSWDSLPMVRTHSLVELQTCNWEVLYRCNFETKPILFPANSELSHWDSQLYRWWKHIA